MADTPITPSVGAVTAAGAAGTCTQLTLPAAGVLTGKRFGFRTAAATTEQAIRFGPCRVYGVYPEVITTAGSVTLRDTAGGAGLTAKHIMPIGSLTAGKTFGPFGVDFPSGLTVQLSNAADLCLVVGEAI